MPHSFDSYRSEADEDEEISNRRLSSQRDGDRDVKDEALVVRPTAVPMGLWCRDLTYTVKGGKTILEAVTICAKPGELTGVIGSSGAGKTSLINCLLNRARKGKVTGDRGINGLAVNEENARMFTRYVMSADTNLPYLTVRETLYYTAELRLPNFSKEKQQQAADEVMQWLQLGGCADTLVGGSWRKGISKGQMKRVAIAQELLGNPEVMILDEPTTGLDSALALELVHILRAVARHSNKTIIASIHQPSQRAFETFDRIILLSEGRVIYHGPTDNVVAFFNALGRPITHGLSPPDFLMEIATDRAHTGLDKLVSPQHVLNAQDEMPKYSTRESLTELHEKYLESNEAATVLTDIQTLSNSPTPSTDQLIQLEKYSSWKSQFAVVWRRSSQNTSRNPISTFIIILVNIIQAILLGTIFWQLTVKRSDVSTPSVPKWPMWDNVVLKYLTEGIDRTNSTPITDPLRDIIENGIDGQGNSMVFDIMVNPAMVEYIGDMMICLRDLFPMAASDYPRWHWEEGSIMNGDKTPGDETTTDETPGDETSDKVRNAPEEKRSGALDNIFSFFGMKKKSKKEKVKGDGDTTSGGDTTSEGDTTSGGDGDTMSRRGSGDLLSEDEKYEFKSLPLETVISSISGIMQVLDSVQKTEFKFSDAESNRDDAMRFWQSTASAAEPHATVVTCCLGFEYKFALMGKTRCVEQFPDYKLPTFPGAIDWQQATKHTLTQSRRVLSSFLEFAQTESLKEEGSPLYSMVSRVSPVSVSSARRRRLGSSGLGGLATDLFNLIFRDESNPVYPLVQNLLQMGETIRTCSTPYCVALTSMGETIGIYLKDLVNSLLSVLNVGGAVFFMVGNMGFMTYDVLLQFPRDRALFNKEKADGFYRGSAYLLAKMAADFPLQLLPTIFWAVIFYFMIGFTGNAEGFVLYILVALLICFTAYSFGYLVSALSPRLEIAIITAPLILIVMLVCAGFMLRDQQLASWIAWFRWVSIYRYGFFSMMLVQFPPGGTYGSIPNEVATAACGVVETRLWVNCLALLALAFGFRALSYFALLYTNRTVGLEA